MQILTPPLMTISSDSKKVKGLNGIGCAWISSKDKHFHIPRSSPQTVQTPTGAESGVPTFTGLSKVLTVAEGTICKVRAFQKDFTSIDMVPDL
jgi:hypothetical protein